MIDLKYKRLTPTAQEPKYAHNGDACFDICADFKGEHEALDVDPHSDLHIPTGLAFEIPEGYAMIVYSRSGHGFKHRVRLANSVGIIDSGYRGEVAVSLSNDSDKSYEVRHGDRIAQAMLIPVPSVRFIEAEELSDTERGTGGFGSTGVSDWRAEMRKTMDESWPWRAMDDNGAWYDYKKRPFLTEVGYWDSDDYFSEVQDIPPALERAVKSSKGSLLHIDGQELEVFTLRDLERWECSKEWGKRILELAKRQPDDVIDKDEPILVDRIKRTEPRIGAWIEEQLRNDYAN